MLKNMYSLAIQRQLLTSKHCRYLEVTKILNIPTAIQKNYFQISRITLWQISICLKWNRWSVQVCWFIMKAIIMYKIGRGFRVNTMHSITLFQTKIYEDLYSLHNFQLTLAWYRQRRWEHVRSTETSTLFQKCFQENHNIQCPSSKGEFVK